jgi:hypothetical protein
MKEQLANNAASTLSGGIDDSETTLTVADASTFPGSGNFRLIVESELMLCTSRAANVLTVERGIESTTAAAHADGAAVTHIVTVGGLDRWARDNDALHGSDRPALGRILSDAGAVIQAGDFIPVNLSSPGAVATDHNDTVLLQYPAFVGSARHDFALLMRTAPSPPYAYGAALDITAFATESSSFMLGGLAVRDSGTGKFITLSSVLDGLNGNKMACHKWDSLSSFSGYYVQEREYRCPGLIWMKVEDDSTNLKFSLSADGVHWALFHSAGRTDFLAAPDQIGFFADINSEPVSDLFVRLCHWSRES